MPTRARLAAECILLFIGVPAAYAFGLLPIPVILLLIIMASGCWVAWRRNQSSARHWTSVTTAEWRRVLLTCAIVVPLMTTLLWLTQPSLLFSLIRQHPKIWLLVMIAYPLLSVLPQEFVYRVFFFERYAPLFGCGLGMVIASAVLFSFAHLVFRNWQSVALTLAGGFLFARTYQRTKTLKLVCVEHALYGWAIFTIGYGRYFFEGTWRLFHDQH